MRLILSLILLLSFLPCYAVSKDIDLLIDKSYFVDEGDEELITDYAKDLGKSIKSKWYPREYKGKYRTIVKVSFTEFGDVDSSVSESSGDYSFDQSALAAVERSTQESVIYKDFNLEYVFQYKNKPTNFSFMNILRMPARILAGFTANKLGLNEVVLINL